MDQLSDPVLKVGSNIGTGTTTGNQHPATSPDRTCTAEGQMIPGGWTEFNTADIGFGLYAGH